MKHLKFKIQVTYLLLNYIDGTLSASEAANNDTHNLAILHMKFRLILLLSMQHTHTLIDVQV